MNRTLVFILSTILTTVLIVAKPIEYIESNTNHKIYSELQHHSKPIVCILEEAGLSSVPMDLNQVAMIVRPYIRYYMRSGQWYIGSASIYTCKSETENISLYNINTFGPWWGSMASMIMTKLKQLKDPETGVNVLSASDISIASRMVNPISGSLYYLGPSTDVTMEYNRNTHILQMRISGKEILNVQIDTIQMDTLVKTYKSMAYRSTVTIIHH